MFECSACEDEPLRTLNEIQEENRRFLEAIRLKHPMRSTACSALLSEIMTAKDVADRSRALDILGLRGCRRGIRQLESLIPGLEKKVEMPVAAWGPTSPERSLLRDIFVALGRIDTDEAQGALANIVRRSPNPVVRADAMEAMAFGKNYDLKLVLPFISISAHEMEICSALYAAEFRTTAALARRKITPLLSHPYNHVRYFAILVLRHHRSCRDLISSLKDDPDGRVRGIVADSLRFLDDPWRLPTPRTE